MDIHEKFARLGVDNAPGQEVRQKVDIDWGETMPGKAVDFSHGDVDAHQPIPGSLDTFIEGVELGAAQAYTEYRGAAAIRRELADRLSTLTGRTIDPDQGLILTPGTQGALFLAMGANIVAGDRVAYIEPDYFANRKLIEFLEATGVPLPLHWMDQSDRAGLDLAALEEAFQSGVKVFIYSNPNNPTGAVYARDELERMAELANKYNVTVIADELYARQIFAGHQHTHMCSLENAPQNLVTIMGPSKTESMSGYRVGVAFGPAAIIERMEKLQAIVSLRCGGYSQRVLKDWLNEPSGWLDDRIQQHQAIRDDITARLSKVDGIEYRATEGGSYLFIKFPSLTVSLADFIRILRAKANVIVTPGTEFGPQFTDWFRINFSQDRDAASAAIERTLLLMEDYRQ